MTRLRYPHIKAGLVASVGLLASTPACAQLTAAPAPYGPEAPPPTLGRDAQATATAEAQKQRDEEPNQQDALKGLEVDKDLPDFFDGASLVFKPRTYYLDRDRDTKQDNVGWALGGALEFKTGWAADLFQVAATVYTSQILHGPSKYDGTLLFQPGPEPFTVVGEANITARLGDGHGIRVGRQSFDLPWLARHDIRMAPNTFEAAVIGKQSTKGFAYIAGYVDTIKRKNEDHFISMSEAAGAPGTDKGLALVGAQYTFKDGSVLGFTNQASIDVMNTLFGKAEKSFALSDDTSIRVYVQYTDQRSIGDELIGDFKTHLFAVKGELFWKNASIRLAASTAGKEKGLQSPFGGPPNYLSIIVDNFDRAGEDAYMVGASYDFKGVGVNGLSMFGNIATGNTPDSGPSASPDETEYDLTVDYKFMRENWLKGLSLRMRGAWIDQDESEPGGDDFFDFRVIVNWTLKLI
jgi:hypothetical protein